MTRTGDHSPHPRLVWDLRMRPVASEQFCMCVSNWRLQISALQNRVGRGRLGPASRGGASRSRLPPLPFLGARHLHSHCDIPVVSSWLSWLERLSEAAPHAESLHRSEARDLYTDFAMHGALWEPFLKPTFLTLPLQECRCQENYKIYIDSLAKKLSWQNVCLVCKNWFRAGPRTCL